MAYTPNPADATQPTDAISAETAQAEFRALKLALAALVVASGTRIPKRQTALAGPVDANGISATIAASATALGVDLKATSSPQGLVLAWANGFNGAGEQDSLQVISNDLLNYWASLPINNTSYLACDYVNGSNLTAVTGGPFAAGSTVLNVASAAAVQLNTFVSIALTPAGVLNTQVTGVNTGANTITLALPVPGGTSIVAGTQIVGTNPFATATKAPPQYGLVYDRTKQACLQFSGAAGSVVFPDDFGNTWTAQAGAKVQVTAIKFGTGALGGGGGANALNGTTDFIKSANITSLGGGSWALRCWVQPTVLPAANTNAVIMGEIINGNSLGALLEIVNNAGTIKFGYRLSSNGTTSDIANDVQGTTTPIVGTYYFVELTYDALAGVYRLYVNGAQEASTASVAKICSGLSLYVGGWPNAGSVVSLTGYIDKPEFLPYCDHPNGTAYAVPTATPSIIAAGYASDWFDIANMQLRMVTAASAVAGVNPGFTQKNRLYIGEADTSGVAVSTVRPYAIAGKYIGAWVTPLPALNTFTSKNDNIGTDTKIARLELQNITVDVSTDGTVGNIFSEVAGFDNTADARMAPVPIYKTRNTSAVRSGNTAWMAVGAAGTGVGLTLANWQYRIVAERAF